MSIINHEDQNLFLSSDNLNLRSSTNKDNKNNIMLIELFFRVNDWSSLAGIVAFSFNNNSYSFYFAALKINSYSETPISCKYTTHPRYSTRIASLVASSAFSPLSSATTGSSCCSIASATFSVVLSPSF